MAVPHSSSKRATKTLKSESAKSKTEPRITPKNQNRKGMKYKTKTRIQEEKKTKSKKDSGCVNPTYVSNEKRTKPYANTVSKYPGSYSSGLAPETGVAPRGTTSGAHEQCTDELLRRGLKPGREDVFMGFQSG